MNDLQELMATWQQVTLEEKKKLDPVGQEDGDIDNDGDTDSSDEYLKNRRKKVSSSVKSQKDEDCDCDATEEKEPKKKVSKKEGYGATKKEACGTSYSKKEGYGAKKEGKVVCPECNGKDGGCDHCEGKGYHMKEENVDEAMGDANHKKAVKHITDLGKKNKMSVGQQRMHIDNYPNKYDKKTLAHAKTINSNQNRVESLEDMVLPTARTFAKWTEFSEKYDEVNSKGKKRPQDMPIGQSSIRDVDSNKHTKGATPPEGIMDKESPKSKEFYKDHQKSDPKWENLEDEGHDDVSKAGRGVKSQSPNRMGRDNRKGDNNVINPITQKS